MKLLPHHRKVLAALDTADGDCGDRWYLHFKIISRESGIEDVAEVRRIVRHLARRGLAEYGNGLFTDEGEMAGSGYRITALGEDALVACEEREAKTASTSIVNPVQP